MVPSSFMISQITPAGMEPGDARQVNGRLRLPGADQHAAIPRAQRKHVARTRQIARHAFADQWPRKNGRGAVVSADARGRAAPRVD
jgi:hypothetical protein